MKKTKELKVQNYKILKTTNFTGRYTACPSMGQFSFMRQS